MAKAILKFDLSDPYDVKAHKRAVDADKVAYALWEIAVNLKRKWKHADKDPTLDEVFDAIHDLISDHRVNIDDLA